MPFNRPPTMSLRATERPKTRPRPRRAETASPPRRSNTRKVNVVSQASLAMLNPAYAMGIEAGPSWQEEEEARWRAERARKKEQADAQRHRFNGTTVSPIIPAEPRSPWCMSPTPELEAFLIDESLESQLGQHLTDGDVGEGALGSTLHSMEMARKQSSESVFEDDEPSSAKRRPIASSNSSSTLSRFFTWKRSPRGKVAPQRAPSPSWAVPKSAPPQMRHFDLPSLEICTYADASLDHTLPRTPVDVFTRPIPSTGSLSKVLTRSMSRKSSMPTLRDIRRAAANTSGHDISLAEAKSADASSSFYWRCKDETSTPTLASSGTLTPSNSNSSSLSGRLTPLGSSHRISSLGRGLASPRKSTIDVPMTTEYRSASPSAKTIPRKKSQQLHPTRNDPWTLQKMPPLPTSISIASLVAAEEEDECCIQEITSSSACSSGSSTATIAPRRRSRSVGSVAGKVSLPSLSLTTFSADADDEGEMTTKHATRVNLASRTIVGTASPTLFTRDAPSPLGRSHSNALLKVMEPLVVVNVMPPTPDLGGSEQETFESSAMSPNDGDNEEAKRDGEGELSSLVEGHCIMATPEKDDICAGRNVLETEDQYCSLQRNDSIRSDMSQSTIASASSDFTDNNDEPFGFARSMSTMSLASDSSSESDSACSHDTEEDGGEEEDRDCKEAQIISASSTMSSFSRAHFVSPRMREVSGWSSKPNGAGDISISSSPSNKSFISLASRVDSPPTFSERKSKRLSSAAGQSLANVVAAHSNKNSPPEYCTSQEDLSSPVELHSQIDETDCDTPRLSGSSTMATTSTTNTKPLNVKKTSMEKQDSPVTTILSPPRLYPRAHNAESPHLELDLSLPLDLHDIGPIVEPRDSSLHRNRDRPRVPQKSRARVATTGAHYTAPTGEPKTPPSTTCLLASVLQEGRHRESFGLGLGLGLGLENAIDPDLTKGRISSAPKAQLWQRPRHALIAHRHTPNTTTLPSHIGFAI